MASVKMAGRTALGAVFAATLVATTAGTAHAAAGESSAYGVKATLGSVVSVPETVKSAYPGGPPESNLAKVALGSIGSVNAVKTTSTGNATDGTTKSTARTAEAAVDLTAASVGADAITTTCAAAPGAAPMGKVSVVNGAAKTPAGIGDVEFPANPAPNTSLTLPAGLGSVVLNEQIKNSDGSLTVNAVHVKVASSTPLAGDLVIASATCKAGKAEKRGAITGTAVDKSGDKVPGVAFELKKGKPRAAAPSCTGNSTGSCTFPSLPAATYQVCVTDVPDGYRTPGQRCKAGIVVDGNHRYVRFVIPEESGKKA
ncbi:choice-of-anchor P family protein [Streptomyces sp. BH106]|uniref:choice-of-anchor P family protein n=1 Tax=Streptomyces sp. BH106 TaxID=3410409 RepID=UPI003CEEA275